MVVQSLKKEENQNAITNEFSQFSQRRGTDSQSQVLIIYSTVIISIFISMIKMAWMLTNDSIVKVETWTLPLSLYLSRFLSLSVFSKTGGGKQKGIFQNKILWLIEISSRELSSSLLDIFFSCAVAIAIKNLASKGVVFSLLFLFYLFCILAAAAAARLVWSSFSVLDWSGLVVSPWG